MKVIPLLLVVCTALTTGASSTSRQQTFASALDTASKRMHHAMMQAPRIGDADRDFVEQMIPHHQGAIDMARALLLHGKDRELQQLAKSIITDQQNEIRIMKLWLENHPRPAAKEKGAKN